MHSGLRLLALLGAGVAGAAFAQAPSRTPAPPALFDAPGVQQTAAACAACHTAATFTPQRHSADEWAGIVDQMVSKGAVVSNADYDVIVGYLAHNYGPVAAK